MFNACRRVHRFSQVFLLLAMAPIHGRALRASEVDSSHAVGPATGGVPGSSELVSSPRASELAAEVATISGASGTSRTRKGKQISAAVRTAVIDATADTMNPKEIVDIASGLVGAAASAAPAYVDIIASSASFTSAVMGVPKGAIRVRAAAYAAVSAPKPAVAAGAAREQPERVARVESAETSRTVQPAAEPPRPVDSAPETPAATLATVDDSGHAPAPVSSVPAAVADAPAGTGESPVDQAVGKLVVPQLTISGMAASASAPAEKSGDEVQRLEALDVKGDVVKTSTSGLRAVRQEASVSMDTLSNVELKKFVSTDVSSVLIRIPGVSMATSGGAKFAVIRGLAERYNPVLLDGMALPSPDPEKQSPQVDIFPTRLMDALVVYKTFEPRLPGTGTGGTIDLRTQAVPDGHFGEIQVGMRFDEGVFKGSPFLTYPTTGNKDLFGLGKSDRASRSDFDPAAWANVDQRPHSAMAATQTKMPPGYQFGLGYGEAFPIGREGRQLGFALNLTYNSSYSTDETTTYNYSNVSADGRAVLSPPSTFHTDIESEARVALGGAAILGFKLSENHQFYGSILISQTGDDRTNVKSPYDGTSDGVVHELHYKQRQFLNYRIGGRHTIEALGDLKADWVLSATHVSQDEPDFRYSSFSVDRTPGQPARYSPYSTGSPEPRSSSRYWREGEEEQKSARVDFGKIFADGILDGASFDFGGSISRLDRTYVESSLALNSAGVFSPISGDPQKLGDEIAASTAAVVPFQPYAAARAAGQRNIDAYYASFTLPFWQRKLKWMAGVRAERIAMLASGHGNYSTVTTWGIYSQFFPEIDSSGKDSNSDYIGQFDERRWLPSTSLTWSPLKSVNVRVSAYKTVALPSSREMGPYITWDTITDVLQHGNVSLKPSEAVNYDARVEWFGRRTDLVAVSLFSKTIQQPIEKVKTPTNDNSSYADTWVNNPGEAAVKGAEFEFRKNLGFIAEPLANLTLGGNATWVKASVPLTQGEFLGRSIYLGVYQRRRLYDQPEWLANVDLTWALPSRGFSTTLSANYTGNTLYVTRLEEYNLYRDAAFQLDWTISQRLGRSWNLRFSARNLTDPDRAYLLDPTVTVERYLYRSGRDGRVYTTSLTRTF